MEAKQAAKKMKKHVGSERINSKRVVYFWIGETGLMVTAVGLNSMRTVLCVVRS